MCGVIGLQGNHIQLEQAKGLLQLLIHRGQDASGLAWVDQYGVHRDSKNKGAPSGISIPKDESNVIIGSTRYPTFGTRKGELPVEKFAQPFSYQTKLGPLSLCHNGQITNMNQLTDQNYYSDAEFITFKLGQLIDKTGDLTQALVTMSHELDGAYSIVGILGKILFAFRDPRGIRPIVVGYQNGLHAASSESLVLQQAGITEFRNLNPGEVMICQDIQAPPVFIQAVKSEKHAHCMFEYVYFASAASRMENKNIYQVRIRLGEELGQLLDQQSLELDYVIPVPDTSKTAATSLSEHLKIPLREAILKNRSSMRTFIMPAYDDRLVAAKSKYLFIDALIKDKNILLVDDSIVRGLTLKYLIEILRERGAKSIHIAITNPPTKFPCYYGVDFTTDDELIASTNSTEEIADMINADSLTYLSLEGLHKAIDIPNLCDACLTGKYPTPYGSKIRDLVARGVILSTTTPYEVNTHDSDASVTQGE